MFMNIYMFLYYVYLCIKNFYRVCCLNLQHAELFYLIMGKLSSFYLFKVILLNDHVLNAKYLRNNSYVTEHMCRYDICCRMYFEDRLIDC